MSSFSIALKLTTTRLRRPALIVGLVLALAFAALVAVLERRVGSGAADRSLTGAAFGLVLPLVAWGTIRNACRCRRLDEAFSELARHGADRRLLALGQAAASIVLCLTLGVLVGALTVLSARGLHDAATWHDAWASASVGALAGAAYACWFSFGASFGQHGGGRTAFLLLDWVLGSSASLLALPLPRGHVLNLLGATPPLGMSQAVSGATLLGLTFLLLALAISRIPR
jgi:hypothetical protein